MGQNWLGSWEGQESRKPSVRMRREEHIWVQWEGGRFIPVCSCHLTAALSPEKYFSRVVSESLLPQKLYKTRFPEKQIVRFKPHVVRAVVPPEQHRVAVPLL